MKWKKLTKWKDNLVSMKKILLNYMTIKRLISKIYKQPIKLHLKEGNSKNGQNVFGDWQTLWSCVSHTLYTFEHFMLYIRCRLNLIKNFLGGSMVQNPPVNAGDAGWIPGSRRSPRVGNGNPLQYSCLGNPMDRGAWGATVHGVPKESDMIQQLNNNKPDKSICSVSVPWHHEKRWAECSTGIKIAGRNINNLR